MGASSMAINTANIVDFTTKTVNAPSEIDSTFTEIVTKFNAMLETATGHTHDGTDSRAIGSGVAGLTIAELNVARIMGFYL